MADAAAADASSGSAMQAVVDSVAGTVEELSDLRSAFTPGGAGIGDGRDGAADGGQGGDLGGPGESDDLDWEQFDLYAGADGGGGGAAAAGRRRARAAALARRLREELSRPSGLVLRDKVTFLLGSLQIWATAYWMGWSPATFYRLYTGQALVLLGARYVLYRRKKWHYYMLDFCYCANVALLLHLWLLPRSLLLSKVTYSFNTGVLSWSTLAFRNSLVYHDLDKVTSVFLHLGPACVSWTLRWHQDRSWFGPGRDAPQEEWAQWEAGPALQLVALPLLPYAAWAVAYWATIFVFAEERIRRRNYTTLFTYVTTTTKGLYAAISRRVPPSIRPQVYLLLHMCFCLCTFVIAWLCWRSFALHTSLLAAMGALSVWHGGTWYFSVFATRYVADLARRAEAATADPKPPPAQATAAGTAGRGKQQ